MSPLLRVSLLFLAAACDQPGSAVDPAAHCPARAEIDCATDIGGFFPRTLEGSTAGAEDGYSGSQCGIGGGIAVEDAAYRFTAPAAGFYRFNTDGSAFQTVLSVRRGSCAGREIACDTRTVALDLAECESVTVVIDGFDADGVGAYRLSIDVSERECFDGVDDDLDGATDCSDSDCFGARCDAAAGEWPEEWRALEAGVLEAVNRVRAQGASCGGVAMPPVPALAHDFLLELAARRHSTDMAEQGYFDHVGLDGRMPADRIADAGFTGSGPFGENIAHGVTSVDDVMAGWMASPGHCQNIMTASYRTLGVGYAGPDAPEGPYWTQNFAGAP